MGSGSESLKNPLSVKIDSSMTHSTAGTSLHEGLYDLPCNLQTLEVDTIKQSTATRLTPLRISHWDPVSCKGKRVKMLRCSGQQGEELDVQSSNVGQVIAGSQALCRAQGTGEGDASHGLCALKASLVTNCLSEHVGQSWNWSWREIGSKRHTPLYPFFIHGSLLRTPFS